MNQTMTNAKNETMNGSRLFVLLASATALLTVGLIVFGAVVRVTDSGLGCGNDWPLCNGTIFPPLDNVTAWIEWLHRLFAALIGIFGLATLFVAWRAYRRQNQRVLTITIVAAVLFIIQSILGAIVVVFELPPTFVTLHLGTAMLLLAALLLGSVFARYRPQIGSYLRDQVTTLMIINATLSFVVILTGALVRGSGATLACTDWPLCFGEVLPVEYGQLALIHMVHRFSVLILGITLLILVWQIYRTREDTVVRNIAVASFVFYLLQAGVGAMFVISVAGAAWGAAHVGMASAVWGLLVVLCVVEYMNSHSSTALEAS